MVITTEASSRAHGHLRRALAIAVTTVAAATALVVAAPGPVAEAATTLTLTDSWGNPPLLPAELKTPAAVAVGPDGLVYVADSALAAVLVFDQDGIFQRQWATTVPQSITVSPSSGHVFTYTATGCAITEYDPVGTFVRTVGSCGSGNGQFGSTADLAAAPDGTLYVVDTVRDRVQRFTADGSFLSAWGGNGGLDGQFFRPVAIAVAPTGTVYVADDDLDRIQAFTPTGDFERTWGSTGTTPGAFLAVTGLTVAPDGSITTVDAGSTDAAPVLQRFASDGSLIDRWGAKGGSAGRLDGPVGVAAGPGGSLFVAESTNHRVQRFTASGGFTAAWGGGADPTRMGAPQGVEVESDGRVLVADSGTDRVQRFTADGTLVDTWTEADHAEGSLHDPWDVAVEADGDVLVVDRGHDRIQRYEADGTPDGGFGTSGTGDGQFSDPIGVAVGSDGDIYVSDASDRRVQRFEPDGTFVAAWATRTTGDSTFAPGGLDLDADGNVYVANTTSNRVEVFTPTGSHLRRWTSSSIKSVRVDRSHDVVYATNCSSSDLRRTDLAGSSLVTVEVSACATDAALSGNSIYVAEALSSYPASRVEQWSYPAGPSLDLTLTLDSTTAAVGTPLNLHLTIVNTGGVALTGVVSTSPKLADCARALADVALRQTVRVDCTYTPVVADVGAFTADVTLDTDQTAPVTSAPISIEVNGSMVAQQVREWRASPTALADGDPLGGTNAAGVLGLDADHTGDIHVTGSRAYPATTQVQRFDRNATFEQQFGQPGTAPGQLDTPERVAVGPDGEVYVTECDSDRIQRFTAAGVFDRAWTEERTWFSREVCSPADIAVGPDGTAYVADAANDRIDVIDPDDGDILTAGWGVGGTGNGQFNTPSGVAVAPDGSVYVLDKGNYRIQQFTADGTFLRTFGAGGPALGRFQNPLAIDVDENGLVYVADQGFSTATRRVQVFAPDGQVIVALPITTTELAVSVDAGGSAHLYTYPYLSASSGAFAGVIREYVLPAGPVVNATLTSNVPQIGIGGTVDFTLRIDNLGTVPLTGVTADTGGLAGCTTPVGDIAVGDHRTVTCSSTATADHVGRHHLRATVDTDQTPPTTSTPLAIQVALSTIGRFGAQSTIPIPFNDPRGMIANWQGDLYVADCGNDRVQHLSTSGQLLGTIGTGGGPAPGQFDCPVDVALAGNGNVLVLNQGHANVHEFQPDGTFVRWWSTRTTSPGLAWGIDVDADGNIYVTDGEPDHSYTTWESYFDGWGYTCCIEVHHFVAPYGNNLVRRFTPEGTFLNEWGGYSARFQLRGLWITGAGDLHLVNDGKVEVNEVDGTRLGGFTSGAKDVGVDRFGNVWVSGNDKVRQFTQGGNLLAEYTIVGAGNLTLDRDHVYVTSNHHVVRLGVGPPVTTLSGRVTADGSGAPVDGAFVVALRASDLSFAGGAPTGLGDYWMELPPGQYLLQLYDPSGRHGFEWYDNKPDPADLADITRVTLVSGQETRANAGLVRTTGSITGSVASLSGVQTGSFVIALRNGTPAGIATTANGSYRIDGLRPGNYTLAFVDPTGRSVPEFHTDTTNPSTATPVAVTAGSTQTINATLATLPTPTIAGTAMGRVTQEGSGQPVEGALVLALRTSDLRFVQATRTDHNGDYSLPLPAGDHYLQVADPNGLRRPEWYDDHLNPASFSVLTPVSAGGVADAALTPTGGALAGTIAATGSGSPLGGVWVIAAGPDGSVGTTTAANGTYSFAGLAAGDYLVVVVDPTAAHRPEYHDGVTNPTQATLVPVTVGATTTVNAALDPA